MLKGKTLKTTIIILFVLSIALIALINIRDRHVKYEFPKGIGVHIHGPLKQENLSLLKKSNVTFVRLDLRWAKIEKKKGVYDFKGAGFDESYEILKKMNITPYFTLDYSNDLYEKKQSIRTEEGRKAFSNFVREAVKRYGDKGVIWEVWNEPNEEGFWNPQPSYNDYTLLVKEVAPIIKRENKSKGYLVGPALAGLYDGVLPWLEETFKRGILNDIDAISVHPYRGAAPETVISDYQRLEKMINKYTNEDIPIISGEWGYSSTELSERDQAKYLERMLLVNIYMNIPVSIWFDWRNYGEDFNNKEHNYGLLKKNQTPKLSYKSMTTITSILKGFEFKKRLEYGQSNDYILQFENKKHEKILVFWTTEKPHNITVSLPSSTGKLVSSFGKKQKVVWNQEEFNFEFSNSPQYLIID
ncbi:MULTISPECIES: cellulase family glycosylhydrolase [Priestia]|uniref:cellulase family glycosylhydrolase n=1 Tax=Priestia TaxID=2800373 RepID=UPI002E23965D|nr:cellulase family glycosylhydrolase [Priestia aryabhattai]MED4023436.1 cellulase family glycosylhydrolase [Priestia aryabhattai]